MFLRIYVVHRSLWRVEWSVRISICYGCSHRPSTPSFSVWFSMRVIQSRDSKPGWWHFLYVCILQQSNILYNSLILMIKQQIKMSENAWARFWDVGGLYLCSQWLDFGHSWLKLNPLNSSVRRTLFRNPLALLTLWTFGATPYHCYQSSIKTVLENLWDLEDNYYYLLWIEIKI